MPGKREAALRAKKKADQERTRQRKEEQAIRDERRRVAASGTVLRLAERPLPEAMPSARHAAERGNSACGLFCMGFLARSVASRRVGLIAWIRSIACVHCVLAGAAQLVR